MKMVSAGLLAFAISGLVAPALAQTPLTKYALRIERQPLVETLRELSKQTGLQVVGLLNGDRAEERRLAGPLDGLYTAEAALSSLLEESKFVFVRVNETTIAVTSSSDRNAVLRNQAPHAARPEISFAPLVDHQVLGDSRSDGRFLKIATTQQSHGAGDDLPSQTPEFDRQEGESVEEVVVTGTHIRGAGPIGSRMIVLDRQYIDESGYGRIEDVLATLPQNFNIVNETSRSNGNTNRGAEIQLRGLGPGTTLTLVNGRRQPAGGISGAITDITSIPASAIDHIEILSDGASAIYGSDAIGGVVNVILRKDFRGAESNVRVATASGERDSVQLSQLVGLDWDGGNLIAGYQYSSYDYLRAEAREYSAASGDYRAFGGSDFRVLFNQFGSNPGTILCPTGRTDCTFGRPAFAIPAGQDGTDLAAADLIPGAANYTDQSQLSILPSQKLHAVFLSASHDVTDNWELFVEGRYGQRDTDTTGGPITRNVQVPSTNPFYVNPFGGTQPVRVAYDFSKDLGSAITTAATDTYTVALGSTTQLAKEWQLKIDGSYSRESVHFEERNFLNTAALAAALADTNPATALNVFGDGSSNNPATLNSIRANPTNYRGISDNWYSSLLTEGPIFSLPGGLARFAIGGDFRHETYRQVDSARDVESARDVSAMFAEFAIPLVGPENSRRGLRRLEVSIAGRYENYSDFGSTFDPKIGVNYLPLENLKVRGTWGTSFKAPSFYQADERISSPQAFAVFVADPQSATGSSKVLRLFGNNPDLSEETADTWSAGFDVLFPSFANSSISLTYYSIDYKDKIQIGTPTLELEDIWAPLIIRSPSQAQIDEICGALPVSGDCTGPIAAILDSRQRNLAVVKTSGLDLELQSSFDTDYGSWSYGVGGTYTLKFEQAVTETSPLADLVNTVGNPLQLRLRGRVSWHVENWNAGLTVNHMDDYHVSVVNPEKVKSWTTVDANIGFQARNGYALFDNTKFSLSSVNLFDQKPPFVNQYELAQGYDNANSSLLGRLVSLQFTKEW